MANLGPYDVATVLVATKTLTASATETTILDLGPGVTFSDLVVQITAIDNTTGDEAYAFEIEGSADLAFTTPIRLWQRAWLGAQVAEVKNALPFIVRDGLRNRLNETTYRYVRLKSTLGGTTPSVTLTARLTVPENKR